MIGRASREHDPQLWSGEQSRHGARARALSLMISHCPEESLPLEAWKEEGFDVSIGNNQGQPTVTVSDSESGVEEEVLRIRSVK